MSLYGIKDGKLIRDHVSLDNDIETSARVRAFCGSADNHAERIERFKDEVLFCFRKFEETYDRQHDGSVLKKWDSMAKDAIEWLMRAIADREENRHKEFRVTEQVGWYFAEANRLQFIATLDLLKKVPSGMNTTIEFLTISLWLCWVDECNQAIAADMFHSAIAEIRDAKDSYRYRKALTPALVKALEYLRGNSISDSIIKVETAYTAFVEHCGEATGGENSPFIDALAEVWIKLMDPRTIASQMTELSLLRNASAAAFRYIGKYIAPQLQLLDAQVKSLLRDLEEPESAKLLGYSENLREVAIYVGRNYNLGFKTPESAANFCNMQFERTEGIVRRWKNASSFEGMITVHIQAVIFNQKVEVGQRHIDV